MARRIRNELDRMLAVVAGAVPSREIRASSDAPLLSDVTNVLLVASFGSLGDDALRAGTAAAADERGMKIQIWVPGGVAAWPSTSLSDRVHSLIPLRVGNSGFLTPHASTVFGSSDVVVIGADTISGDYLHGYLAYQVAVLRQAVHNGHRAALVNFSITASPSRTALRLLKSIPRSAELWARDELSQHRASKLLGRDIHLAPDIGALAHPVRTDRAEALVTRLVDNGYVCFGPNAHFETLGWYTRRQLVDFWVGLATALPGDTEIVLVPHDLRERPGDVVLAEQIASEIRQRTGRVIQVFVPISASEAKFVLGNSKGLISGRMHACVSALASGVPTVGLEYLGKFVGQFEWYGELGRVLSLEDSLDYASAGSALRDLMASRHEETKSPITVDSIGWLRGQ